MKIILIVLCLIALSKQTELQCSCEQLKSQEECQNFKPRHCEWSTENNSCAISVAVQLWATSYCSQQKSNLECINKSYKDNCTDMCDPSKIIYPCAWADGKCQMFPGCTAFPQTTHNDCQNLSLNCTSDGTQCIKIGECADYKLEYACQQRNLRNKYCSWDQLNLCTDVLTCPQAPKILNTHDLCFQTLSSCTVDEDGYGCSYLKQQCSDYTTQAQCKININQNPCFWDNSQCIDLTCSTAPSRYQSTYECPLYMPICVYIAGIGCTEQLSCSKIKNAQDCSDETRIQRCWWNNFTYNCVEWECENAPKEYQTFAQCKSFKEECSPALDGYGCTQNKGCTGIKTQTLCTISSDGSECYWNIDNNICYKKTCDKAPSSFTTYDQCNNFLPSCTIKKEKSGCEVKICSNAPDIMKTNEDCEKYLPNNNCITMSGGGCRVNGECDQINAQAACVKDINGIQCYWVEESSDCITKQCDKAPPKFINLGCNNFLAKCQLNSSKTGCEDNICINQETEDKCQIDYNGQSCKWQNRCIERTCENASKSILTYLECQLHLKDCTLSNLGFGCMQLPLQCLSIKTKEGCQLRRSNQIDGIVTTKKCDWINEKCIDRTCDIASKSEKIRTYSNLTCKDYLNGCYVNNEQQGCMILPICSKRGLLDVCEIEGNIDCIWNAEQRKCMQKSCTTANVKQARGSLTSFSQSTCLTYQLNQISCQTKDGTGCCTLSNDGLGCMDKPDSCNELKNENNCTLNATKSSGDCYWKGTSCVTFGCSIMQLIAYNHQTCFTNSNGQCTVYKDKTKCDNIKKDCQGYDIEDQCTVDSYKNECVWTLSNDNKTFNCEQAGCDDITASNFLTHRDCQDKKETCTVIPVVGDGCIPLKSRCFDYKFQQQCQRSENSTSNNCIWNGGKCWELSSLICSDIKLDNYSECEKVKRSCKTSSDNKSCIDKICSDFTTIDGITGTIAISTYEHCQNLNKNCSINAAGNACVDIKLSCSDYNTLSCKYTINKVKCASGGGKCFLADQECYNFTGNNDIECKAYRQFCSYPTDSNNIPLTGPQKCVNRKCSYFTGAIVGSSLNHDICQNISPTCTASFSKATCVSMSKSCYENKGNKENCVRTVENDFCKWTEPDSCITISRDNCNLIDSPKSFNDCYNISSQCTINRNQNECVNIETSCSLYTKEHCFKTSRGYCTYLNQQCQSVSTLECSSIDLGTSVSYQDLCNQINPKCTNYLNQSCQTKSCQNATISEFTHNNCYSWLSECTVNSTFNGCVIMKPSCKDQTNSDCLTTQLEGQCVFDKISNLCIKKTCYNSPGKKFCDKLQYPLDYMDSCTVAQPGGCQTREACRSYLSQIQCLISNTGGFCFWNPTFQQCVDYQCENIEKTSKFDTHNKCVQLFEATDLATKKYTRCTVHFDSTGKAGGCMSFKPCYEYKHEEQCQQSNDGTRCNWNFKNLEAQFCEDRTCDTAPKTITKDEDCKTYELTVNTNYSQLCTIDINEVTPGVYNLGGCRSLTDCIEYKRSEQCRYDQDLQPCNWYNEQCYSYQCSSAPFTITSAKDCELFKSDCTIDVKGNGCMKKDPLCETFNKIQCIKNSHGNECFWDTVQNKCIQITCTNQPQDSTLACSSMPDCLDSTGKQCISKSCSDFLYKTDIECKQAPNMNGMCTTDGTRCIKNTQCEMALVKEACKVNNLNQTCVWVEATTTYDAFCKTSLCDQALNTMKTEVQCQQVSSSCTLRAQGGCKEKIGCSSIEIEGTCLNSSDMECKWNKNTKTCEDYLCKTFKASNHKSCKDFKSSCTISPSGYCMDMTTSCDQYTLEAACVETKSGEACQWLPNNKCIKYSSCSSLPLTTDAECKKISKYCTSDSNQCVPIKLCKDTANISCITGSDGDCMLSFTSEDASSQTCSKFNKCSSIKHSTHKECQTAYSYCTSNGENCTDIFEFCSSYKSSSVSCVIVKTGQVIVNGQITSTGKCVYDKGQCRDETCEDFGVGTTHSFCNQKLSICTTNGTKCIQIQDCESYNDQGSCVKGKGSNGLCYWTSPSQSIGNYCKLQTCNDVMIPSTDNCSAIRDCIYNGTKCINKSDCGSYTTQIACQAGSIKQETCYWIEGQCKTANNCKIVASDSAACRFDPNCIFSNGTCIDKSCDSMYQNTKQCIFFSKRENQITYCYLKNDVCQTLTNFAELLVDQCLINSNYAWRFLNNSCQSCNPSTPIGQNPVSTTNDESAYNLETNFILFALLLYN